MAYSRRGSFAAAAALQSLGGLATPSIAAPPVSLFSTANPSAPQGYHLGRPVSYSDALSLLVPSPKICSPTHGFPWDLLIDIYIRDRFSLDARLASHKLDVGRNWVAVDDPQLVRIIHHRRTAEDSGLARDLFVGNVFIAMYVNSGAMDMAAKVFAEMPRRDAVTCNAMILGYASRGMWAEFSHLLRVIPQVNNTLAWNAVVAAYLHLGDHLQAIRLISHMTASGSAPDSATFLIGLNACSLICSLRPGMEIHGLATRMHCDTLDRLRNNLIAMYSRCDRMQSAHLLYRLYRNSSSAHQSWITWDGFKTWNSLIATFISEDRTEEAFWVFRDMIRLSPKEQHFTTLRMLISLCACVRNVRRARELHCYITKDHYEGCLSLWNALFDTYARLGASLTAQRVFHVMTDDISNVDL